MVSSLLRPKKSHPSRNNYAYFTRQRTNNRSSPYNGNIDNDDDSIDEEDDDYDENNAGQDHDRISEEDGDEQDEATPLLPIFSAAHLDSLPIYSLTHSIRLLIVQRCETTLAWEQLRSPQISQFLVKPIQSQIRTSHFSRATLYALLANCWQFNKEAQINPGNVGVLKTRGLVAELLAMRLLKEFSVRELIDALSYDFDPLQGASPPPTAHGYATKWRSSDDGMRGQAVRTSTLEIAIRAQAKRFLAHPLCVGHLESIWAGTIVFHSAADSLHRYPSRPPLNGHRHYGATHDAARHTSTKPTPQANNELVRRSVTLYNPSDASLFKLSRLRVPRYRSAFSTISYAIMLGLFLAVLAERSLDISALEIVFWFWSAGFMLDEIVGFSEQGFSLYIISVWNAFDIGILLLFFAYYILRLYGIVLAGDESQHTANMAYDVLASTAVLLFPRWFAFLDHYRYFSQLLIAFRLMAVDLAAILLLVGITCSGFFVAFSFSFGSDGYNGPDVAYEFFQILLGFTPAAWDIWDTYNPFGKILLTFFLVIAHFMVVTILITVLTNSFMAIVKNANEEHQFLFAVNVLSMVKSDALFSYIAPSNVLGWIIVPLRYCMPFRHYVRINRTVIKATHFPVLFIIFAYERIRLSKLAAEPAELVEIRGRQRGRLPTFALNEQETSYERGPRVREPSITTRYKDRALSEVFARPFQGDTTLRSAASQSRQVNSWIDNMGDAVSPPAEEPRSILEQLETTGSRPILPRSATSAVLSSRLRSASRSMAMSEPGDHPRRASGTVRTRNIRAFHPPQSLPPPNDADADAEDVSHEDDEMEDSTTREQHPSDPDAGPSTPVPFRFPQMPMSSSPRTRQLAKHDRHTSVNTIVYKPEADRKISSSSSSARRSARKPRDSPRHQGKPNMFAQTSRPTTQGRQMTVQPTASRARPIMPPRNLHQSTPNLSRFLEMSRAPKGREPSFDAIALDLASDIGDNRPYQENNPGVAGSVNTNFHGFSNAMRNKHRQQREQRERNEETSMMSRLVLARMNTLEEGFKDILKEVKDWRSAASSRGTSDAGAMGPSGFTVAQRRLARRMSKEKEREQQALNADTRPKTALQEGKQLPGDAEPGQSVPGTAKASTPKVESDAP